uniref:Uncharacterized protein n=1 Tax=Desulfobacca acetoxidans TaxID=60893 RepID=A0A7V4G9I5_9BACT
MRERHEKAPESLQYRSAPGFCGGGTGGRGRGRPPRRGRPGRRGQPSPPAPAGPLAIHFFSLSVDPGSGSQNHRQRQ